MIVYEKAHPGEEEKIVDFANYVFSLAHRPHNFRTLLPKMYAQDVKNASMHYVAHDENGNIRAMVAAMPLHMTVCGHPLLVGTVGTVGVHPYARGEGHMKQIMRVMEEDCRQQQMDVLCLGGRRQRYNYFGFEWAGANALMTVNRDNVRHAMADVDESGITLREITDNQDKDIPRCFELYQRGMVCGARPLDRYLDFMRSWNGSLFAIRKNGAFAGELALGQNGGYIAEILLENEDDLLPVIKKWFLSSDVSSIELVVFPNETRRMQILENVAEEMTIAPCQMIRVLNFRNTLSALLPLACACRKMDDGCVTLGIGEETLRLTVKNGKAQVENSADSPDLRMTPIEAQRKLFLTTRFLLPDAMFRNWLPLPWVMPSPDHF